MLTRSGLPCFALVLLAMPGCYEESSTPMAIETGIDPDRPFASLTHNDWSSLCKATLDAIDDVFPDDLYIELGCALYGATMSREADGRGRADQAACERHRDKCLANLKPRSFVEAPECDFVPEAAATDCDATVRDFERCTGASLHAAVAIAQEQWNCAWLAEHEMPTEPSPSPECASFEMRCEGFAAPIL